MGNKLSIYLRNVRYKNNSLVVLKTIDINIKNFGLYQIKGPNGVGKTTFFKTLNGELFPEESNICIKNSKINIFKSNRIILFDSDFTGYLYLTPLEYIEILASVFGLNIDKPVFDSLYRSSGLSAYESYFIKDLSQGNKQKLAAILPCIFNLEFILLDESFEHMDTESKGIFLNWIKNNRAEKWIFVISHNDTFDELEPATLLLNNNGELTYAE
ncbi:ATP-binding cassette domain-containing protein [Lactiplantibacillus sp. WILCCON 0030]|uniref:ATP-binding cassette domain-containing protein n=1 Tax=Lactiplantibacillus brownii TaxID=3069269 RepID=A0ABU1A6R2_9LACO|nr:ATP-binding cassette domain-containing protein [Lactiplantibacillus brownii]MDQ7936123.1 ATP-binding cassette domain-containing protein [Lactiplantibacillus brownii]